MNKRSTQILLSILHICILGICVLTIYAKKTGASEVMVAQVPADTKVIETQPEPEAAAETEEETQAAAEAETEAAMETEEETEMIDETETEEEVIAETEPEASPVYSFHYIGAHANLNIRSTPSTTGTIIGKVPPGDNGDVIELTDDKWALIDYKGITGYCSRDFLELHEVEK